MTNNEAMTDIDAIITEYGDTVDDLAKGIRDLRSQLAEMRDRILAVEELAERAEWKGYDLRADDVLAALNMTKI